MVHRVGGQISVLSNAKDAERNRKSQDMWARMKQLDERISAVQDAGVKKFVQVGSQLQQLERAVQEMRLNTHALTQAKRRELAARGAALEADARAQQNGLKGASDRVLHIFNKKANAVHDDFLRVEQGRAENEANLRRFLEEDIPRLYKGLKEEADSREAAEQDMLDNVLAQVADLRETLAAERKARENSEEAMVRTLEAVVAKMQSALQKETEERQRTEEMLQNLLQATCHKIEFHALAF